MSVAARPGRPPGAERAGVRFLAAVAVLAAADAALLAREVAAPPPGPSPFQAAVGGLGPGSAVSPAWSFHGVDPRGCRDCESELFPVVGAPCCDPGHGAGLFDPGARVGDS